MIRLPSATTLAAIVAVASPTGAFAQEVAITGGTATLTYDLPVLLESTPLAGFNAVFGITETYDEVLNLPPNNPPANVSWPLNMSRTPSPPGRGVQSTTLELDPLNVLQTWSTGNDLGAFLVGGEQIAFGGLTRFSLDPGINGQLLFGEWGLRYSPSRIDGMRSGLVLTSNLDFAHAVFADIGSLKLTVTDGRLEISGDVLIGEALILLGFPKATSGLRIGSLVVSADLDVACKTDIDGDGETGGADLGILLSQWGMAGSADFSGNGSVGGEDLGVLLSAWGSC
ncbi:MAG: hypothetical protein RJA05_458 [Planctomycetota bacterium]|jgi:hypothetical protein